MKFYLFYMNHKKQTIYQGNKYNKEEHESKQK